MNDQLEQLGLVLEVVLGVLVLVITAAIIYVCWLLVRLHRMMRRPYRLPEVERDGNGRPLRERV